MREQLRAKLLSDVLNRMSEEERREYLAAKNHDELLQALQKLEAKIDKNKQSWISDFGANIAGNAVFDGAVWVVAKLLKRH